MLAIHISMIWSTEGRAPWYFGVLCELVRHWLSLCILIFLKQFLFLAFWNNACNFRLNNGNSLMRLNLGKGYTPFLTIVQLYVIRAEGGKEEVGEWGKNKALNISTTAILSVLSLGQVTRLSCSDGFTSPWLPWQKHLATWNFHNVLFIQHGP